MLSVGRGNAGVSKPLHNCLIRCDSYLRTTLGATYGYTRTDENGRPQFHGGIDLYANDKTPCFSIYKGRVEWVMDFGSKGWGKVILTSVEFPSWTCYALYAHLSCVYVQPGQKLSSNVMVGLTGISGNSSVAYPHLHFEIWKSRDAGKAGTRELYRVDPLHVLGPIPFKNLASDILERKSKRQNTVNLNVIGGIPV